MTLCLAPTCCQPRNPVNHLYCQTCGAKLLLRDRYRPLTVLGQGGFGRTFLASDLTSPEHPYCVVKQFFMAGTMAPHVEKALEMFRQEATRLKELGEHLQIPDLRDSFELNGHPYLVQSFVEGKTLAQELSEQGNFSEEKVIKLLLELLPVLQFIHDRQVIHRDIKPDNIIRPPQQPLNLVDFGAAKFVTMATHQHTGTVIGSAGYAAPEQAVGKAIFASDLYSLGATCAHLLTGVAPLDLYSFSEGRLAWRDFLPHSVSQGFADLIDRLLAPAVKERYGAAAIVLRDVQPLASSRPSYRPAGMVSGSVLPASVKQPAAAPAVTAPPRNLLQSEWKCVNTLCGHDRAILSIALHPDSRTVVSSSTDKTLKIWRLRDGERLDSWEVGAPVMAIAFSRRGQFLAASLSNTNTVNVWMYRTGVLLYAVEHAAPITSLCFDPHWQETLLASGGDDGTVTLCPLQETTVTLQHLIHTRSVTGVTISPNGKWLASSGSDDTVKLWHLATGALVHTLEGHTRDVNAIAFTPDGHTLLSGGSDHKIKLWDVEKGSLRRTLSGHDDWVLSLAVHPSGQLFASSGKEGIIHLWDLASGKLIQMLSGHAKDVNSIAFTADGLHLVSGSSDRTIKIWQP